jgi:hypothetical protein
MFPCKYLTYGNVHALASQKIPPSNLALFDDQFRASMEPGDPDADLQWSSAGCGHVDERAVQTWVENVVGYTGASALYGTVPVTVHGLTVVGCMTVSGETVAKIEFITYRYGDGYGVHYAAQVAIDPYRFLWYAQVGAVAESDFALLQSVSSTSEFHSAPFV